MSTIIFTVPNAPVDGTQLEEAGVFSGGSYFSQVVLPLTNPAATVPNVYFDNVYADVIPVDYDSDGNVSAVNAVCYHSGSNPSISTIGSGSAGNLLGRSFDLSGATIELVAQGVSRNAILQLDPELLTSIQMPGIFKNGVHIFQDLKYAQFTSSNGNLMGAHIFYTYRKGINGVEITIIFGNDVYDPSADPSVNPGNSHYSEHDEVAGDIYFETIRVLPGSGKKIMAPSAHVDGSHDIANGYLVRDEGWQVLPGRSRFMRRFFVTDETGGMSQSLVDSLGRFEDHCVAISGPMSIYSRRWYGPQMEWLCQFDTSYSFNGQTGRQAGIEYAINDRNRATSAIATGTGTAGSPEWATNRQGWFFPYGQSDADGPGGGGIYMSWGHHFCREDWEACALRAMYNVQRHATTITDPNTGVPVTVTQLVTNNHKAPVSLTLPFHEYGQNRPERWFPHFLDSSCANWSSTSPSARYDLNTQGAARKPQNRVWNTVPAGVIQTQQRVQPFWSVDNYHPYDSSHLARYYYPLMTLAWGCNWGPAKWLIIQELTHQWMAHSDVKAPASTGNGSEGWLVSKYGSDGWVLPDVRDVILGNGGQPLGDISKHGGILYSPSITEINMQRGFGHDFHMIGMIARVLPEIPYKTGVKAWIDDISLTLDYILTDWGGGYRIPDDGNDQNYPQSTSNWGASSVSQGRGVLPAGWTCSQVFHSNFFAVGCYSLEVARGTRITTPGLPTTDTIKHERAIIDFMREAWDAATDPARHADNPRPASAYTISSSGSGGANDAPDSQMKEWNFQLKPDGSPTTSPYPTTQDHRAGGHMAACLMMLDDQSASYSDIKGFAKRLVGLADTATDAQLVAELQARMSGSDPLTSRPNQQGFFPLMGAIQNMP